MSDHKEKQKKPHGKAPEIIAGLLPGDYGVELFSVRETRKVFALSNGNNIPFANINRALRARIFELLLADPRAMEDLRHLEPDDALEEFAFCMYGQADGQADFAPDGTPGPAENFMCSANCRCLKWTSKSIAIHGTPLTPRQIEVAKMLATDLPDKAIADALNITQSTLNTHKANLFDIGAVKSRTGFAVVVINHNIA